MKIKTLLPILFSSLLLMSCDLKFGNKIDSSIDKQDSSITSSDNNNSSSIDSSSPSSGNNDSKYELAGTTFKNADYTFTIFDEDEAYISKIEPIIRTELKLPASVDYLGKTYNITAVNLISDGELNFEGTPDDDDFYVDKLYIPKSIKQLSYNFTLFGAQYVYYDGSIGEWAGVRRDFTASYCFDDISNIYFMENGNYKEIAAFTDIVIPDSITRISDKAYNFMYLTIPHVNLYLPKTLKNMGAVIFDYYTTVTIYFEGELDDWMNIDYYDPIYSDNIYFKNQNNEYYLPTSITIKEGVKEIKNSCFYSFSSLTEVKLPSTLEKIGAMAFSNCSSLKNIELPNGLKSIANQAFSNSGLEQITISDSVNQLGVGAFNGCSQLSKVKLSKNIKEIPDYCFKKCPLITTFDFSNITSIGVGAFDESGLTNVTIPSNVKFIGKNAFANTPNLVSLTISSKVSNIEREIIVNDTHEQRTTVSIEGNINQNWDKNAFKDAKEVKEVK